MRGHNIFAIFLSILSYRGLSQGITVYDNANYKGQSAVITGSTSLLGNDWNDRISSIKVPKGYKVQVFENPNYTGASIVLTGNWTITPASTGWKNKISAIRIIEDPEQPAVVATPGSPTRTAHYVTAAAANTTGVPLDRHIVTVESGDIRKIDERATKNGLRPATPAGGPPPGAQPIADPAPAEINTPEAAPGTTETVVATKQFNFKEALSKQTGGKPQNAPSPVIATKLPTPNPPAATTDAQPKPVDTKFVETKPIENRNKEYAPTHPLAVNQPAPIKKYGTSVAASQPVRTMATGKPAHVSHAANDQGTIVTKTSTSTPVCAPKAESTATTAGNPPVSSVSTVKPVHTPHATNGQGATVNRMPAVVPVSTPKPESVATKSNDAPAFAAGKITDKKQVDSHAVSYGRIPHAGPLAANDSKTDTGGKITVVRLPRQGTTAHDQAIVANKATENIHAPNGLASHQLIFAKPEKENVFERKSSVNLRTASNGEQNGAVGAHLAPTYLADAQYDKKQFGNQRILTKRFIKHPVLTHSSPAVHLTLASATPNIVEHKPAEVRGYGGINTSNKPVMGTGQKVAAGNIVSPHAQVSTKKEPTNSITRLPLKDSKKESGGVRLTKEQMNTRILPFKINDVAIDGNNVSKVIYITDGGDHGSFEYLGNGYWTESSGDNSGNYVEVKRDKWSVYLKDSRDMTVQIDLYQKKVFSDRFSNRNTDPAYTIVAARYAAK